MKQFLNACSLAAILVLGLAAMPGARADEASQPQTTTTMPQPKAPEQTAREPMTPYEQSQADASTFNPNVVPPWSKYRNGAGEVIDPVYGFPVPGYGVNAGN